jgi:hypothetical protein
MFRKLFTNKLENIILGRWKCTDERLNKIKVYWANMDHCGTCSKKTVQPKKPIVEFEVQPKNKNQLPYTK